MTVRPEFRITENALCYAWTELARRCGGVLAIADGQASISGVCVSYGAPSADAAGPEIVIASADVSSRAEKLLSARDLHRVSKSDLLPANIACEDSIPVLFSGDPATRIAEYDSANGRVTLRVDLVATTLFLLGRWEEYGATHLDEHGRFPADASLARRADFVDRPIVDEYAQILAHWIEELSPHSTLKPREFTCRLSCDVDRLRDLRDFAHFARTAAGDLVHRKSLQRAASSVTKYARQTVRPTSSDECRAVLELAQLATQHAIPTTFYFLSGPPRLEDGDYDVRERFVRELMRELIENGCEVGLHGSYRSIESSEAVSEQAARIREASGVERPGSRQHYLRFRTPDTWRDLEAAGLSHDATLGFADREGFRASTCFPFRPFDFELDRELDLIERPLIAMDVSLLSYRGLSTKEAIERILELAARCAAVGGEFSLLWHNSSLVGDRADWRPIIETVLAQVPLLINGPEKGSQSDSQLGCIDTHKLSTTSSER
ncbi:MAG: polysaccharide deacetylase family protein [Planctomycetota bacterium]